jgi:hypothetical protein
MITTETIDRSMWQVPREWPGERFFVICSGESVASQADQIRQLKGRFIAVKHGVLLRPDADVLFLSGERSPDIGLKLIPKFTGRYIVARSRSNPAFPDSVKVVTRTKDHEHLCELRDHVCGYDSGTSAINLAWHFGAAEIILLGYDMRGKHFCKHPLGTIPQQHHDRHMGPLEALARDCAARGVRVVNCSPISAAPGFERGRLEDFL